MFTRARRISTGGISARGLAASVLALLIAGPTFAAPLGLVGGDVIDTISWDALAINGDGGNYTWGTVLGTISTDARITSSTGNACSRQYSACRASLILKISEPSPFRSRRYESPDLSWR